MQSNKDKLDKKEIKIESTKHDSNAEIDHLNGRNKNIKLIDNIMRNIIFILSTIEKK